jgi:ATP-dependent DNA ligase
MMEKFDGVRGFWNPKKKTIFSRKGRQFPFPAEILDAMPSDTFLDGELWYLLILSLFPLMNSYGNKVWFG